MCYGRTKQPNTSSEWHRQVIFCINPLHFFDFVKKSHRHHGTVSCVILIISRMIGEFSPFCVFVQKIDSKWTIGYQFYLNYTWSYQYRNSPLKSSCSVVSLLSTFSHLGTTNQCRKTQSILFRYIFHTRCLEKAKQPPQSLTVFGLVFL